jgi:hypothetical protein
MPQKSAAVILGMHRSGTSALSRVLSLHGFSQPRDLMPVQSDNPKGFWESWQIAQLNDEILASVGGRWDEPGPFLSPGMTLAESRAAIAHNLIQKWLKPVVSALQVSYGDEQAIVLKDPRLCVLLPLWQRALIEMGFEPRYVLCYRHPLEVAASLAARNAVPMTRGLQLWTQHVIDPLPIARERIVGAVYYVDLLRDDAKALSTIFPRLEPPIPLDDPTAVAARRAHLSTTDRHHVAAWTDPNSSKSVSSLILAAWHLLREWNSSSPTQLAERISGLGRRFDEAALFAGLGREAKAENAIVRPDG